MFRINKATGYKEDKHLLFFPLYIIYSKYSHIKLHKLSSRVGKWLRLNDQLLPSIEKFSSAQFCMATLIVKRKEKRETKKKKKISTRESQLFNKRFASRIIKCIIIIRDSFKHNFSFRLN